MKRNLQDALVRIKKALVNLSTGKYGKCDNCGNKIEDVRLDAMPTATLCISCSQKKKTSRA
jgi:RNA polymerase-binding transcription factor DksA